VNLNIKDITHPDYNRLLLAWRKYRLVFKGGADFIEAYLKSFNSREDPIDFYTRKDLSYAPSHAKAAVMEVKNAIFQRMPEIKRANGTVSYKEAVAGRNRGVDHNGNTMNGFIGRLVLPDLLSIGRIGVYVDRQPLPEDASRLDTQANTPYLYTFAAEDIRSWTVDPITQQLKTLLLRDSVDYIDEDTGLVSDTVQQFRLLQAVNGTVKITIYDVEGVAKETSILNIPAIPFVVFELSHSLLIDIADHQIALLNLASSDMNYAIKSNFPFYVEQYDPQAEMSFLRTAIDEQSDIGEALGDGTAGEAADAAIAKDQSIKVGVTQGRRHPIGTDAPGFIAPPTAPLLASMEKQEQIKAEILQLINLAVTTLKPSRASAESKREDAKGLEAGLSYVGLELEYGERQIQVIWAMYEDSQIDPSVTYPQNYSLRTDESRRQEAKELLEFMPQMPSKDAQKELAKEVAEILLGHRVSDQELQKVRNQIDNAEVIVIDPKVISMDLENGLVSTKTASEARLYPKGDVKIAQKEHAERAAAIVAAQKGDAARGSEDTDPDPKKSATIEKAASRNTDKDVIVKDKTRGEER